ncbi:hypothetical protein EYR36_004082 [Pleurotus pulmonarius]|nr:hypothetical protein EYR36_004082 [Pleurotus pulmonarius]KAF4581636.1 hypothetical protein EYR38_002965 [Pleurotus pulmonarius]
MSTPTADLKSALQGDIPRINVRNHLKILGAFTNLIESISKHAGWTREEFFQRSTYRLQLWVEKVINIGDEEQPLQARELPPLDVAMALHSLMLSPARYFEDSELRFRQLKRMEEYPLAMVVDALGTDNSKYSRLENHPAPEHWRIHTGLHYDAIDSMQNDTTRSVTCPACQEAVLVSWRGDRGFSAADFHHTCPKCRIALTHDVLRAGKFFASLNRAREDPKLCLPNTAILLRGELGVTSRCSNIVNEVWKCFESENGKLTRLEDIAALSATERCSIMEYIAKTLSSPESILIPENVPLLLRAFEHSYPFTQDIVDALRHQYQFMQIIHDEGWSQSTSKPSDDDLDAAYAEYAEFLQRIAIQGSGDPQWRDDLLWHTHQLMPTQYRVGVVIYIQYFLDHLPRGECTDQNGTQMSCGKGPSCGKPCGSRRFLKAEA